MHFVKLVMKIIIVVLLIVVVGGFIFIRNFDLNKYKPYISELVYEQTGRTLEINGEAKLALSFIPTLVLNDVSLSNAEWGAYPQMVSVGSLEVKLSVLPLLKRKVEIDNITIINPVINLEIAENGEQNWNMMPKAKVDPKTAALLKDQAVATGLVDAKTADKAVDALSENPQMLALAGFAAKNVLIENGVFNFDDRQSGSALNVEISKFAMSVPSFDANVSAEFDVLVNGQRIKGNTVLGSVNTFLNGKVPFPVELNAEAYGAKLTADGVVANIMENPEYAFKATAYNSQGNMGAPEIEFAGNVSGIPTRIGVDITSLNVNGNLMNGTLLVQLANQIPYIDARLNSDKIDVESLMPQTKTAWQMPSLVSEAQAAAFVPNDKIPYEVLKQVNAYAELNVKSLVVNPQVTLENVVLNAVLMDGVLDLKPSSFNIGGGKVDVSANVNAATQNIQLNAVSQGVIVQQLYAPLQASNNGKFGIVSGGNVDVDVKLTTKGATYRQVVENANGQLIVIADKSVVRPGDLGLLSGNFITQLLKTLRIDTSKKVDMDMNCAVVRADIKNGVADFPKGIAFSSKPLNVVSNGKLNLKNDALDFTVRPYSGQIIDANLAQALSSFIKIKGTVESPKIVLDDQQAIKALVGVAATGGTSYLGSQLLLDADPSPCYTALKGTSYQSRFPAPEGMAKVSQDIYQGANDAVNDSINAAQTAVKDGTKAARTVVDDAANGSVDAAKAAAKDVEKSVRDLRDAAKGFLNSLKKAE